MQRELADLNLYDVLSECYHWAKVGGGLPLLM
jgi:hypothetical protein